MVIAITRNPIRNQSVKSRRWWIGQSQVSLYSWNGCWGDNNKLKESGGKRYMSSSCKEESLNEFQEGRFQQMLDLDRHALFHPYTSLVKPLPTHMVESANGCTLRVRTNGSETKEVVDGMSSWWAAVHGYNVPEINHAIQSRIHKEDHLSHVMFGGLTHAPAVELAETLLPLLQPMDLTRLFFACSGSVAVEVALKLAIQYHATTSSKNNNNNNNNETKKHKIIAVRGGYHGDTIAAMSVSDPDNGLHQEFFASTLIPNILRADKPTIPFHTALHDDDDYESCSMVTSVQRILEEEGDTVAALIVEPIVQGAGGMRFYSPHSLHQIRKLTKEHNVLLIVDEIATGFGRTGKMFASQYANIQPDILCAGKALTGGYCSFGVVALTDQIAHGLGSQFPFMHGPTFMANPLACSISKASIQLLLQSPWEQRVAQIEKILTQQLMTLRQSPHVHDVRVLGAIGVVELHQPIQDMAKLTQIFIDNGVWIRPFGKLLYLMPPFIITPPQLTKLCSVLQYVIEENHIH